MTPLEHGTAIHEQIEELLARRPKTPEEVARKVEEWHNGAYTEMSLHEYLGWSWREYAHWAETDEMPNETYAPWAIYGMDPEEDDTMADAYAGLDDDERNEQARVFFSAGYWLHPCRHEDNWTLNWFARRWYAVKLLICWALDIRGGPSGERWWDESIPTNQMIEVHAYRSSGGGQGYCSWSADWMEVGRGVFRNWHWRAEHDGECAY